MTANELRNEISRLMSELLRCGLAVETNAVLITAVKGGRLVSWPRPETAPGSSFGEFARLSEFLRWVATRDYSCILQDGALLQLSFICDGDRIVWNRLCYYPCPVSLEESDWREVGDPVFLLEEILSTEATRLEAYGNGSARGSKVMLRPALRFDYAPEDATAEHPCSHLTFGHENTRCAVYGPLSVGHFVRFVVKHFYPDAWARFQQLREWPLRFGDRSIEPSQEMELYLECRQ